MLQIEARLERVISACERRGVVDGHERIGARQRETSFEGNRRRIRNRPGERRARDDVERIDRRAELPERVADVIARDGVETFLRQRRARLGAVPVADRELVHERRAQRPRVVQNQAGVLECVVLAEQAPVRGAGRDRKTLIVRVPRRKPSVDGVFRRGTDVDSRQVLVPGHLQALLELVVVVAARDRPVERVRQRKHVQQRASVGVDSAAGNLVVREGATGDRIPKDDQLAALAEALGEVAGALERGRYGHRADRLRHLRVPVLEGVEEEQLVAPAARHGAAERRPLGRVAVERLRDAIAVVEEVVRVQLLVTLVQVSGASVVLRSRLGDDADHGAAVAAVLRLVVVQLHLHFADGVEVDRAAENLRASQIVADEAVDRDGVPGIAIAADVRARRAEAAAWRLALALIRDTRQHPQQRHHVASTNGDHLELRRRDERRALRACGLNEASLRERGHGLGQCANRHRDGAERQPLVGGQVDVLPFESAESGYLDANRIATRLHG